MIHLIPRPRPSHALAGLNALLLPLLLFGDGWSWPHALAITVAGWSLLLLADPRFLVETLLLHALQFLVFQGFALAGLLSPGGAVLASLVFALVFGLLPALGAAVSAARARRFTPSRMADGSLLVPALGAGGEPLALRVAPGALSIHPAPGADGALPPPLVPRASLRLSPPSPPLSFPFVGGYSPREAALAAGAVLGGGALRGLGRPLPYLRWSVPGPFDLYPAKPDLALLVGRDAALLAAFGQGENRRAAAEGLGFLLPHALGEADTPEEMGERLDLGPDALMDRLAQRLDAPQAGLRVLARDESARADLVPVHCPGLLAFHARAAAEWGDMESSTRARTAQALCEALGCSADPAQASAMWARSAELWPDPRAWSAALAGGRTRFSALEPLLPGERAAVALALGPDGLARATERMEEFGERARRWPETVSEMSAVLGEAARPLLPARLSGRQGAPA